MDERGALANRGVDLPGFGIAAPGTGKTVGEADLDDLNPGRSQGMVVLVPLAADHDRLVAPAAQVGQVGHCCRVEPGHAGGRAEQQCRRGTGGDEAGLGSGVTGDDLRGAGLEGKDIDAALGSLRHRGCHLGPHAPTRQACGRPLGVDDGLDPQLLVDVRHPTCLQKGWFHGNRADLRPVIHDDWTMDGHASRQRMTAGAAFALPGWQGRDRLRRGQAPRLRRAR